MNPWKIIGWIVLGFFVLMIGFCSLIAINVANSSRSSTADETTSPDKNYASNAPTYSVTAINLDCTGRHGMNIAKVTVKNTGSSAIPFAKAFFNFKNKGGQVVGSEDSYFSPTEIPPGAVASADAYNRSAGVIGCSVSAIQDGSGNPVRVE